MLSLNSSFYKKMRIAMEADDITSQTANEVRSITGSSSIDQNDNTSENSREENLNKTDDIFGLTENEPSGDINDNDDSEANTPSESEQNSLDNDGINNEENTFPTPDNNPSFIQKNTIRDNMVQLYNIIGGDTEIIVNNLTNINDSEVIKVLNIVLNHLRNSKDYLFKTLTQNFNNSTYEDLLQKYITIKRVYDICGEMLKRAFASTHYIKK